MTVESNYAIAKLLRLVRGKIKINRTLYARFFPLQLTAVNSGWFIARFPPVVIGRSSWYWFFDSRLKTALITSVMTLMAMTARMIVMTIARNPTSL